MPLQSTKIELLKSLNAKSISTDEDHSFTGLEFDSRRVKPGNLFVALRGEQKHGHEFLKDAFGKGAVLALIEDPQLLNASTVESSRLILVKDTYQAMAQIAAQWRKQLTGKIIAITGSAGKTTTKEICAAILKSFFSGKAAEKSFNNHIGVPYALCSFDRDDVWNVVEIGMNHPGEIAPLSQLVQPHLAIVTSIGPAHIEFFKSEDEIADEKLQIASALFREAILILNKHDEAALAAFKRNRVLEQSVKQVRYVGEENSDLNVSNIKIEGLEGTSFTAQYDKAVERFETILLGRSNCMNIGAALLAVLSLFPDLALKQIVPVIKEFSPPVMRLNKVKLEDGTMVIDDSYNANPLSMEAALNFLGELKANGMKVGAVLGEMRELGSHSKHYHSMIGDLIAKLKLDLVIGVGQPAQDYVEKGKSEGLNAFLVESPNEAANLVRANKVDVVLVKASRVAALERVIAQLQ